MSRTDKMHQNDPEMDRKEPPQEKQKSARLRINRSLPNISKVVRKHWKILFINKSFKEIFQNEPVTAFKHNKNLKEQKGVKKG